MTKQIIESELKGRIKKDDELKLKLAKANKVRVDTVNRWLREDDEILTTVKNLAIIREYFKLPKRAQLTEESEAAV
jgi:MOSC domain-containing protein YiiM